jgi:hypothetical protein
MSSTYFMIYMKIPIIECVDFSEWLTKKFIAWRGDRYGNSASVAEFAKQFGASHQLVLDWMKTGGKTPKSKKYIDALEKVYGKEVYDVLGLPRPPFGPLDKLPPGLRTKVETALAEINTRYAERGITADSPEAESIANEVFTRMGLIKKSSS